MESNSPTPEERIRLRRPACTNCKVRKIKCDRNVPCSSCVTSSLACDAVGSSAKARRHQVLPTQYDDTLKAVHSELKKLSMSMQLVLEKGSPSSSASAAAVVSPNLSKQNSGPSSTDPSSDAIEEPAEEQFEGDTSFSVHAKSILGYFEKILADTPSGSSEPAASVSPPPNHPHVPTASPSMFAQYPELASAVLPPVWPVLNMINLARSVNQSFFSDFYIIEHAEFTAMCANVYFNNTPYSVYHWLLLNIGIADLFDNCDEEHYPQLGVSEAEVDSIISLCRKNTDTAIRSLRVCAEPSLSGCQAMTMAAALYLGDGRKTTAWRLITMSSRMCLDLGLHRLSINSSEPDLARKRMIFWFTYVLEKSLAFVFGRTPSIQDYDLTIEKPMVPFDLSGSPGWEFAIFVNLAQFQGEIWMNLFSAAALRQPPQVREERARALAFGLERTHHELRSQYKTDTPENARFAEESSFSLEILEFAILTTIYRAVPPRQDSALRFCDECVASARKALHAIVFAEAKYIEWGTEERIRFMNWALSFVPLVPYTVVTEVALATYSQADLKLLKDALDAIRPSAEGGSAESMKLYRACERLCMIVQHTIAGANISNTSGGIRIDAAQTSAMDTAASDAQGAGYNTTDEQLLDGSTNLAGMMPLSHGDWEQMLREFDFGMGPGGTSEIANYFRAP